MLFMIARHYMHVIPVIECNSMHDNMHEHVVTMHEHVITWSLHACNCM
jgi:hypothetical protein